MPHILKNKNLEIRIDAPLEHYNFSRFDWTGKIVDLKFQGDRLSGIERTDAVDKHIFGKGFYNEFGIDSALGFKEANIGGWFHKIGVGLLKKDSEHYLFSGHYETQPAEFSLIAKADSVVISCKSREVNGYAYFLKKEIELHESSFSINYHLQNTGEKTIATEEYTHNFMAIAEELIGTDYMLNFPFQIKPGLFEATVNPEQLVEFEQNKIKFKGTPAEQFFFSNLSGGEIVTAAWELIHLKSKLGIKEIASFKTDKVNLWGWQHVISPELFHKISIEPGQATAWSRKYEVLKFN